MLWCVIQEPKQGEGHESPIASILKVEYRYLQNIVAGILGPCGNSARNPTVRRGVARRTVSLSQG